MAQNYLSGLFLWKHPQKIALPIQPWMESVKCYNARNLSLSPSFLSPIMRELSIFSLGYLAGAASGYFLISGNIVSFLSNVETVL